MRVAALFAKEQLDLRRNPGVLMPVLLVAAIALVLPFTVAIFVPSMTHQPLGAERDLVELSRVVDPLGMMNGNARVQLFLFEQCLLLFLLMPITGAMSLAASAIIGEKQARTLEPLLATPITTIELLVAKVLGAVVPTLAISIGAAAVYLALIAALAEPGVLAAMLTARTFLLLLVVSPLAALVSLQFAIVVSSRVNDSRTAQQFGVLLILPLTGILIAQFSGSIWLSSAAIAMIGAGLAVAWVLLLLFSVAMFERETILTRWR